MILGSKIKERDTGVGQVAIIRRLDQVFDAAEQERKFRVSNYLSAMSGSS
jgi:hypothetical protein